MGAIPNRRRFIFVICCSIVLATLSLLRFMRFSEVSPLLQLTNYNVSQQFMKKNLSSFIIDEHRNSSLQSIQQENQNSWPNAVLKGFRDELTSLSTSSYENLTISHPDLSSFTIENSFARGDQKQLAIFHIGPHKTGTTVRQNEGDTVYYFNGFTYDFVIVSDRSIFPCQSLQ